MASSVFVTGTNRGIGLELIRQLACGPKPAKHVFATCRTESQELKEIQAKSSNLHLLKFDVCDESSYARVVAEVADVTQGAGLNLLIHNAGSNEGGKELESLTSEAMLRLYRLNCVAPLMLTKALLPLLRTAAAAPALSGSDVMSARRACVLNISSRIASIEENKSGRKYAYRASKTALNCVTRSLGVDLRPEHILVVAMDPGWVRTDMGGPNGLISTQESAERILQAVETLDQQHTATYVDHFGNPLPW